jgi:hypothetical protein
MHLASCARCRARAEEDQAVRERFAGRIERMLAATRHRGRAWRRWLAVKLVVPVMAAAAAILVLARPGTQPSATSSSDDDLGIKGGPVFQVYALHQHQVVAVSDGSVLAPGDEIRFAVTPQGWTHVLIASLDGAGNVTIYYPYNADRSAAIEPRARTELPGSIVLDDAPGPERLFAVFSRSPILASDVTVQLRSFAARRANLRASHQLAIDGAEVSLLFEKPL